MTNVLRFVRQNARLVAVTVIGAVLVVGGLVLLVLPGPGILVVVLGLFVLGTEYAWARRAYGHTKGAADKAARQTKDRARRVKRRVQRSDR